MQGIWCRSERRFIVDSHFHTLKNRYSMFSYGESGEHDKQEVGLVKK